MKPEPTPPPVSAEPQILQDIDLDTLSITEAVAIQVDDIQDRVLHWDDLLWDWLLKYGVKVLFAVAIFLATLYCVQIFVKVLEKYLKKQNFNRSIVYFLTNLLRYGMILFSLAMITNTLGLSTASILTLLGTLSLTIGLALQGALSNVAAGFLLLVLKPFEVGDIIESQGQIGMVDKIEIFTTTIITKNHYLVILPNNKITTDRVSNISRLSLKRFEAHVRTENIAQVLQYKAQMQSFLLAQKDLLASEFGTIYKYDVKNFRFSVRFWCAQTLQWELLQKLNDTWQGDSKINFTY